MKYDYKKQEKELYGTKETPRLVTIAKQHFIMIHGKGNPNDTDFSNRVGALYALAYSIKMGYKSTHTTNPIQDFTVYPLEGIWKQKEEEELVKEKLEYTIMIRQPDFITEEMFLTALEHVKVKKPNPLYSEIEFKSMEEGKALQILHVGPFDDEPFSFAKMDAYLKENGLQRVTCYHREIYLNNANRTEKSKLKTILRYILEP